MPLRSPRVLLGLDQCSPGLLLMFPERLDRAQVLMREQGVDAMLLSVGSDLPCFSGCEAMPLERLTVLVVPRDGEAVLVVPQLEAPRVPERPDVFGTRVRGEAEDPVASVVELSAQLSADGAAERCAAAERCVPT